MDGEVCDERRCVDVNTVRRTVTDQPHGGGAGRHGNGHVRKDLAYGAEIVWDYTVVLLSARALQALLADTQSLIAIFLAARPYGERAVSAALAAPTLLCCVVAVTILFIRTATHISDHVRISPRSRVRDV